MADGAALERVGEAWLAVPEGDPTTLLVMLHGAGSSGRSMVELMREHAQSFGMLLLAPDSAGRTWDVIEGGFGPDVDAIDDAMRKVDRRWKLRGRIVGGFSDGASYALSVGLGPRRFGLADRRFDHVLAFSPGFMAPGEFRNHPRIFVSHGRQDRVLPVDACSRRIVRALEQTGHTVIYDEFDGGHELPPDVVRRALAWVSCR